MIRLWMVVLLLLLPGAIRAEDYPSRPVTMVVAAAAGGPIDVLARIMAERMTPSLGQSVVVENLGGGGGVVGAQRVVRAQPDGYTTLLQVSPELPPANTPGAAKIASKAFTLRSAMAAARS